jgi:uncharacterized protein with HEPN domain
MTKRAEREWLGDIVAWGERLQRHIADVDRATFFANEVIQDAVCRCIEAVGKAAGNLDDLDRTVPGLSLKLARRARDRIIHGYYKLDLGIVWETATDSILRTVEAARSLLPEYDDGDGAGGGASGGPPV